MSRPATEPCTAFVGFTRIAAGPLAEVARALKERGAAEPELAALVYADATGEPVDLDLRGSLAEVLERLPPAPGEAPAGPGEGETAAPRPPGRPRLGVVAREVTLLPRHWDWLAGQPGGASVALRKLVEHARRANEAGDRRRRAIEATYRVLSALGGNLPGFEEASRALFAGDCERFTREIAPWPVDLRDYLAGLAAEGLAPQPAETESR